MKYVIAKKTNWDTFTVYRETDNDLKECFRIIPIVWDSRKIAEKWAFTFSQFPQNSQANKIRNKFLLGIKKSESELRKQREYWHKNKGNRHAQN